MRITRKATAIIAVAAVSMAGLAGCSSDKKPADDKTKEPAATMTKEDAGAKSGEAVEIEYWHRLPDPKDNKKVSEFTEDFNKEHKNIKVKSVKFEGNAEESYQKITAAIKAGNAPCLAQASYDGIPAMLVRNELLDVSSEAAQYAGKYNAGPWGQASPGGKTYGLPQDTGPLVYYYDKDAFDKLGLKAPTTWEEYWSNAAKAKEAGKVSSLFFRDDNADWFSAIASANGANWFSIDGDSWKVEINSDASKKVAADWQKSIDDGSTMIIDRWDKAAGFDKEIKDGKVIGYVGAGWEAVFNLGELGKTKANWQVAQLPGEMTGPWGGSAVVVLKGCEHPAEALEFANWFNTNMDAMVAQGLVPAAKGDPKPDAKVMALYGGQNYLEEMAKAAERANPAYLGAPTWPAVKKSINDGVSAGTKILENLDKAQKQAVDTMKQLNLKVVE